MAIIDKPSDYFNTKLYTGTGSSNSITGIGFAPDWVWIKNRGATGHHVLFDKVRGATKALYSNLTDAETTVSGHLTSFDSDGFTLGDNSGKGSSNENSATYASWNWKANGQGSSNTDGSINTTYTSVNTTAGFSIVSYTGTGANATVGHGLGSVPKMIIFKTRDSATAWVVYHKSVGATKGLFLNTTGTGSTVSAYFQDTDPTSSVFSVGSDADTNKSSSPMIAYCFAEKQGYSKFGSYTGNGNADGTFVYTGFKPAWVMCKITNTTDDWYMFNNKMPGYNLINESLRANTNDAQNSTGQIDFTAQGFKTRTSNYAVNGSGQSYIYMAFAENPFVASNFNAATAR